MNIPIEPWPRLVAWRMWELELQPVLAASPDGHPRSVIIRLIPVLVSLAMGDEWHTGEFTAGVGYALRYWDEDDDAQLALHTTAHAAAGAAHRNPVRRTQPSPPVRPEPDNSYGVYGYALDADALGLAPSESEHDPPGIGAPCAGELHPAGLVLGTIDLYGRVIVHADGTVRGERARILTLAVPGAREHPDHWAVFSRGTDADMSVRNYRHHRWFRPTSRRGSIGDRALNVATVDPTTGAIRQNDPSTLPHAVMVRADSLERLLCTHYDVPRTPPALLTRLPRRE